MAETIVLLIILFGVFAFSVAAVLLNIAGKDLSNNANTIGRIESNTKAVGSRIDDTERRVAESKNKLDSSIVRITGSKEELDRIDESVERSKDLHKRFGEILGDVEKGNNN